MGGVTTACRVAAFALLAAMMACLGAYAAGWHRAEARPGIVVCLVALVACLAGLRLRGGRQ